ncbi:MAG: recn: dna repair protein recn [Verrucomicrobiales bacterium]|nr:recn: dna repair protein recn [Verrucomicrobiales bacterium]
MLSTLRIKNLALVSDLTLHLQPGYNVITGETGAGKSIIIGALNLVLGQRADRDAIRAGADQCSVEAVFEVGKRKPIDTLLEENGVEPCAEGQLIIKRTFSAAGSNRQFINGSPTTLQTLSQLGEHLVDMHGPHEHQSLLRQRSQLDALDGFAGLLPLRKEFESAARLCRSIEADKAALIVDEQTYAQQLDLLRFQTNEISAARLQPSEEAAVDQDFQRASNAARLLELTQNALDVLSEADNSLLTQSAEIGRNLHELQRLDPGATEVLNAHEQVTSSLRELQAALGHYSERIEVDPARLRELESRVDLLQSLKRKYGPKLEDVIAFGESAKQKLHNLEQRDVEVERLNAQLAKAKKEVTRIGRDLTAQRKKATPKFSKAVTKQLNDLGFAQSPFEVALTSASEGEDASEFQFAPNPGEPPRPLRAIASSGELSRVMLALKTVLASEDQIPVLVFDEIDANVGGETAGVVGEKMLQIASTHQVLCITHLPPVAATASTHFVVSKRQHEGRTISEIQLLDRTQRVNEIARMLGGQTEAARKHAQALLR